MVARLAWRVPDPLVPRQDDGAAIGQYTRAADQDLTVARLALPVPRRFAGGGVNALAPVEDVPVIGGEDHRTSGTAAADSSSGR